MKGKSIFAGGIAMQVIAYPQNAMENFRLRVFRTVAHHLNFRQAAEELSMTQPAVTQQIKALEAELATALFDRTGGRVTLTGAGEALLPFAERIRELSDEASKVVAAIAGTAGGKLSVGASQTIGQYLLPRLIAGFLRAVPKSQVSITGGNTQEVVEALRSKRIDIGLIEGPALGRDVQVTPFMEDHMVCVVPAGHEWADQEISVEDLAHATLLTREHGSGSRRIVENALEEAGLHSGDRHLGMTFDSTEGLLSGVEAGLGVTFVSRWAVRNQLTLGTLKIVRVRGLALTRMFFLVTLTGPVPGGIVGAFHRFVIERAEELAPRPTGRMPRSGTPSHSR